MIELRNLVEGDYALIFAHQRDPVAGRMAAFGTRDPDAGALAARWKRLAAGSTVQKAIVFEGALVGYVASFPLEGKTQVTYWVARAHWGRGVASAALAKFLALVTERPIYASAAKDNVGSLRVLQKCGFTVRGEERAFANARGEEIDEVMLQLD